MTDDQTQAVLGSVLDKTESVIRGVRPEQAALPSPCPDYDVASLVNHLVGWATRFGTTLNGDKYDGDPNDFTAGNNPAGQFHDAASLIKSAYANGGPEVDKTPAGVLLMEFAGHGWDLAMATGQSAPYSEDEASVALAAGQQMLSPEYRGPDKSFGYEVAVPADATAVQRLVGFLGRDPAWTA